MRTVKQVSRLTGVSVRTLQFYDEIGLLKPTEVTDAGYRLYDDRALGVLQQILFFKELDFPLREIKEMMNGPGFDKMAAFEKQRELIRLKRDRLNGLLGLLDRLMKGETCVEFKEFDMTEYFEALAEFRKSDEKQIEQRFGTLDSFDDMVAGLRAQEQSLAKMAVQQYGSVESYTRAMTKSLRRFLSEGPAMGPEEAGIRREKTEALTRRLTARLDQDAASPEVQEIVEEMVGFVNESGGAEMGEGYWPFMAVCYLSNPSLIETNDRKYGKGASRFIGLALRAYLDGGKSAK